MDKWENTVLDVETDDLDATVIHCIVLVDTISKERKTFVNRRGADIEGIEWQDHWYGIEELEKVIEDLGVKKLVIHNGIGFDVPVLKKLLGFDIPLSKVEDTLVVSKLLQPVRDGGHSLRAWGYRLGNNKLDFKGDFKHLSLDMITYMEQDGDVLVDVWWELQKEKEKRNFSNFSIDLEHRIQYEIWLQEKNGWPLDIKRAHMLFTDTSTKMREIVEEIHAKFPPLIKFEKQIVPKITKAGKVSKVGLKKFDGLAFELGVDTTDLVDGPVLLFSTQVFNLGSTKQRIDRLQRVGWKPLNFTDKGQPKVDEESLVACSEEIPEAKMLADYMLAANRNNLCEQWMDHVDPNDGRVHGRVNPLGAVTGRMTHSNPNMANVPSVNAPYGKECRSCWTCGDASKYVLLGCDASGLELRMLAHYMGDPEYAREVVEGDVHTKNQQAAALPTRDNAKTFIYALIYGAGDAKIGSIVNANERVGGKLRKKFLDNTPKLKDLMNKVKFRAKTYGCVRGLDGRIIWTRSQHSALNTLLQGGGAIVCKVWLCYITKDARDAGIDFQLVGSIHDEYQFIVEKDRAEEFGAITKAAMKKTEKLLKTKVPLDSEYKIGKNWAETH